VEPLGIGLVGLGRWGRNYVRTLSGLAECRLVAVADSDPAVLAAAAIPSGVTRCESTARLLSDPAVEAVVIATPDTTHYSLSSAALRAGRDALVEKPMTLRVVEAETVVRQAEDAKRILAVGHTAIYSMDMESLRVRLDALPRHAERKVVAERTSSGPSPRPRPHPPLSGSASRIGRASAILFDLCPHDIAIGLLLFGTPAAVRARGSERSVEYEVRFESGELLAGRAEWREPPSVRRFQVANTDDPGHENASPVSRAVRDTPLGLQCLDFIRCCQTRRQPLSNGQLGLAVVRCLAALDSSCSDSGTWVQVNAEFPTSHNERLGVRT